VRSLTLDEWTFPLYRLFVHLRAAGGANVIWEAENQNGEAGTENGRESVQRPMRDSPRALKRRWIIAKYVDRAFLYSPGMRPKEDLVDNGVISLRSFLRSAGKGMGKRALALLKWVALRPEMGIEHALALLHDFDWATD
jgi:hypothetical protein